MVDSSGPVVTPSVNVLPTVQTDSSQGSIGMEILAIKASFSSGGELSGLLTSDDFNVLSAELDSLTQYIQSSSNQDEALSSALSQIYTEVESLTAGSSTADVQTVLSQTQALSNYETAFSTLMAKPTAASFEALLEASSNLPTGTAQTASYQQIATAFATLSPDLQASMMQDITKKIQSDVTSASKKYGGFLLSGAGNSLVEDAGQQMLSLLLTKNNVIISSSTTVQKLKASIEKYSGLSMSDEQVETFMFSSTLSAFVKNPSAQTFQTAFNSYVQLSPDDQKSLEQTFYSAVNNSGQASNNIGVEKSLIMFQVAPTLNNLKGLAYSVASLYFDESDGQILSQMSQSIFSGLTSDQQSSLMTALLSDTTMSSVNKLQDFGTYLYVSLSKSTIEDAYSQLIYDACLSFSIDLSNVSANSQASMTQLQASLTVMLNKLNLPPLTDTQLANFASNVTMQNYTSAVSNFDKSPTLTTFENLATAASNLPASEQVGAYQDIANQLTALSQQTPPTTFLSIMDGLNAQKKTSILSDTTKLAIKGIIQFAKVSKAQDSFAANPNQATLSAALTAISKLPTASQSGKITELEEQFSSFSQASQASLVSSIASYFSASGTTDADKAPFYSFTSFIYQSYTENFTSNPTVQSLLALSNSVALLPATSQDDAYQDVATSFLTLSAATQTSIANSIDAGLADGTISEADVAEFKNALAAMTPSSSAISTLLQSLTVEENAIFNEYQTELNAGAFTAQGDNFSATDQLNQIAKSLGYTTPLTTTQVNDLMPYVADAMQKQLAAIAAKITPAISGGGSSSGSSSGSGSLEGVSILYAIAGAMVGLLNEEQDKLNQDNALYVVADDKVAAMNNVSNYYLTDMEAGKSVSPEKFQLSIIVAYDPDALDGINANLNNLTPPEGVGDVINKIQAGTPLTADEAAIFDQGYQAVLSSNSSIATDWAGAVDVTTVQASKPDLKFDTSTWTWDTSSVPPILTSPTTLATTFDKMATDITTNISTVSNVITQQLQAMISEDTQALNTIITTANSIIQQYGQSLMADSQNIK